MGQRTLEITDISSPLKAAFTISRGAKTSAETIRVTLREGDALGRGECVPYPRYGETQSGVRAAIEALRAQIEGGLSREALQAEMPAAAARCALDCALWDLEAKQGGLPVWKLAGLPEPKPIETAVTVSLDTAEAMAEAARSKPSRLLKLKLGGPEDLERIEAVHAARPDARLILDGNEGLLPEQFPSIVKRAADLGVVLIEQPFPAGKDEALLRRPGAVSVCADESAHTSAEIQNLSRRYDAVNVKLDKTGGLTEAIRMVQAARDSGLGVLVGCMVGGSLSMAPAVLLAGLADAADLDGPLWLAEDIAHGLTYTDGHISPPERALWG
ncbi:MAG: N-acetyl-D-Glu racemase DgcA [Hyphomonas sp.]|jgi:L-alanine-DL-glutamate epimerase-like enolase superfamily enzyme|uniref:N-acetyl-D-Glu racemase DgcA n=1 Tax=Hyphomonas sp. TaxID=87 RepID=UPI0032656B4E